MGVFHAGRHLADFAHELPPPRHPVDAVECKAHQRVVEAPLPVPSRIEGTGIGGNDATRVISDQQHRALGHPIHPADLRPEVTGEGLHLRNQLAHEIGIELLRRLLQMRFGGFGPMIPHLARHEALQCFYYTRWQSLLEAVCLVGHPGLNENSTCSIFDRLKKRWWV